MFEISPSSYQSIAIVRIIHYHRGLILFFGRHYQAFSLEFHYERGPLSEFTLDPDWSSHKFNQRLADTQSQTRPLMVHLCMLIKLAEVHKQLVQIFLWNPTARVLHSNLKVDVALLTPVGDNISIIGSLSIATFLERSIIRDRSFA